MDRMVRFKNALFVDGGLFFSVLLITAATFSLSVFVDWGTPVDDLPAAERARLEDCAMAERTLGDAAFLERPDCRDVISSSLARIPAP